MFLYRRSDFCTRRSESNRVKIAADDHLFGFGFFVPSVCLALAYFFRDSCCTRWLIHSPKFYCPPCSIAGDSPNTSAFRDRSMQHRLSICCSFVVGHSAVRLPICAIVIICTSLVRRIIFYSARPIRTLLSSRLLPGVEYRLDELPKRSSLLFVRVLFHQKYIAFSIFF